MNIKNNDELSCSYLKAAAQRDADAQFYTGEMYLRGEGVYQDLDQALAWYRKAADQGLEQAREKLADLLKK